MTDYRFEYIKNQMIGEILMEQQKSKILMEQQKSNDEKIRQLKEDIAINKEKLQKLEELQRTKSPVEEAFKKVFSHYPNEKDFREGIWFGFEKGYNASKVSETPQEPEDDEWTLDKLQEKNWYVDAKTNLKSNWEPKPHTPEKTEKSLREAFQKAQQTEEWKETQRKIDAPKESWMDKPVEELVAILEKNPPDCLKFVMSKTLEQLIERWWCDVFVGPNEKWTMEECIADLCDRIFLWLPKEQNASGSQSLGVEDLVDGFNNAIKKIKSKIHNKKVTP